MANNPGGTNQFGSFQIQPGYGDVQRITQLTKAAPISGAPMATQALNAPRRQQRQAVRGSRQQQTQAAVPAPPPAPAPSPVATWQAIAAVPGITPNVHLFTNG